MSINTNVLYNNLRTGMQIIALMFIFMLPVTLSAQDFTEVYADSLTAVENSSVAWGDYDNDGDLDILMTGIPVTQFPSVRNSKIYQNTGSGFSEVYAGSLTGVGYSSVAWGDYDNDGDLDILLTGQDVNFNPISKIYQNTGTGFSEVYSGSLTAVFRSSVAWGDYDNDGDLDILLTGQDVNFNLISKIYQNTGAGFSEVYAGSLTGVFYSSVAWGDYDNDGDLDILLTGYIGGGNYISKIYQNTGTGFSEVYSGSLTGVSFSSVAWGDYDNDGDLDILLTGSTTSTNISKIYQNTGTGFSEVYAGSLTGVAYSSVAWGDYDNDGDLDILLTGSKGGDNRSSKIYQNTGSGFDSVYSLPGVTSGSVAWGDYDNDGDLDILFTGSTNSSILSKIYQNGSTTANTTPAAPTNLLSTASGGDVTLRWNKATDTQTTTNGLTYNIRLGTSANGINKLSPMANLSTGYRSLPKLGNTNHDTAWTIKGLAVGNYYWSVQAIDNAFAGGAFGTEGTFSVIPYYTITATAGANGSLSPLGNVTVDSAASKQFTITPNTGYYIDSVIVDGVKVDSATSYTFTNVTANHTIRAVFAIYTYTITVTQGANGTVSPSTSTVNYGTNKQFTITPNSGYDIDSVIVDNVKVDSTSSYTFTNVAANHTIRAVYGLKVISEVYAGSVSAAANSSAAWGDYDNDGDLDILLTGKDNGNTMISKIYQNTGSGFSEVYAGSLTGVNNGSVAWGDYDNDSDLDILLTGFDNGETPTTKIYKNTGSGFDSAYSLTAVGFSSAVWGDYDNDGDLDILLTGYDGSATYSKIYKNTGAEFSEVYAGSLTPVGASSVAWGDYDNDGDLDILLSGVQLSTFTFFSQIYQNTGSGFSEVYAGSLTGAVSGSTAWGDYDNDGDLDILLTGQLGFDGNSPRISKIYQNTGSGFSEVYAGSLTEVGGGSGVWGDYDNDGDLDILLTGSGISGRCSKIYQNTGSGFSEIEAGSLTGAGDGSGVWGDFDNDGDLDILVTGSISNGSISKLYQNGATTTNTTPAAPANLLSNVSGSDVTLRWNKATDTQTPQNGLTYNIRLGTSANGINRFSPMANVNTGYRRLPELGNTNHDTAWTINGLANGNYYWSVQAIDNAFAGGSFGTEGTFSVVEGVSSYIINATVQGNGTISPSGEVSVAFGGSQTFTMSPSANYHVDSVVVDGLKTNSTTSYTFTNVTSAHTIVAYFSINKYTLTVNATNGSVAKNPDQANYNHGTQVILTATPATGYNFTGWSGEVPSGANSNPLTITVSSNKSITANFAPSSRATSSNDFDDGTTGDFTTSGGGSISASDSRSKSGTKSLFFTGGGLAKRALTLPTMTLPNITNPGSLSFWLSALIPGDLVISWNDTPKDTIYSEDTNWVYLTLLLNEQGTGDIHFTYLSPSTAYYFDDITVTDNLELPSFTLSTSADNGAVTKSPERELYSEGTTVQVSTTPDRGYLFTGWSGDASGTDNPLSVTMDVNKSIQANYEIDPDFEILYRTATYETWATAKDGKGALKSYKRKADKVFFKFNLTVASASNILYLEFPAEATGAITRGKSKLDTLTTFTTTKKKYRDTLETVTAGDTIQIEGIAKQGKKVTVKYAWGTAKVITLKADSLFKLNRIGLPMPNLVNVGEELFPGKIIQTGYYSKLNPLVVGVPQGLKKGNSVVHLKYTDVQKSLVKIVKKIPRLHSDTLDARCLDSLDGKKKKAMLTQQKSLPPDKQNNKLFAEVLSLKLNVAASVTEKFPAGLGQLTFDDPDNVSNQFNGKIVDSIITIADSMLSCLNISLTTSLSELYETVRMINISFADTTIDTLSFASKTKLTGVKSLSEVDYLHPTPGITPRIVQNFNVTSEQPEEFALYQNYPNPFNPSTNFGFRIANFGLVTLKIYNMLGQEVASLLNREEMDAGEYQMSFSAKGGSASGGNAFDLPSGVYFYRINVESVDEDGMKQSFTDVKRMLMLK